MASFTKMTTDELFQLTFHALHDLPEAVFWFDEHGDFFEVNEKGCEHWGYTREELLQMSVFDLNPSMNRDLWPEHWKKKRLDPSSFESTHQKKDGTLFPVDITDNFITLDGKVYCCAIIRDITQRKEESRIARFSDFTIQNVGDAIFWIDADSIIQHVNLQAIDRYGYTRDEFIGMSITSLYEDMELSQFKAFWTRLKLEQQLSTETFHLNKENKKIEVEVHANFIQFEGKEYSASIVRDITDRKRREAALRGALTEIKELKEKLEAENSHLYEEMNYNNNVGDIITINPNYQQVLNQIEQVAGTSSTVLITGESGTGKELLARAVHQLSDRSLGPIIKVDCANIPAAMIESELFGHEKGAFPGAIKSKMGKFELANGGTIFLDEIAELPISLQPKLLSVLESGSIERLGANQTTTVDVRIIACTNRNLSEEIINGNFRQDLFFRLNVFPIESIPLRDRKEDIPLLAKYFAEQFGAKMGKPGIEIPQRVIKDLMSYEFPGNVRELQNLIERGVITSKGKKLNLKDFSVKKKNIKSNSFQPLADYEKKYIVEVLQHTKWRVSGDHGAAKILGMRPTTLFSKMKKHNIQRSFALADEL